MGLGTALRIYSERFSEKTGMKVTVDDNDTQVQSEALKENIFRIYQEALANAVKHSGGKHVHVAVRRSGNRILVEIRDDGKGFDRTEVVSENRGIGLSTMNERVQLLGGTLKINSLPGKGTSIIIEVSDT